MQHTPVSGWVYHSNELENNYCRTSENSVITKFASWAFSEVPVQACSFLMFCPSALTPRSTQDERHRRAGRIQEGGASRPLCVCEMLIRDAKNPAEGRE